MKRILRVIALAALVLLGGATGSGAAPAVLRMATTVDPPGLNPLVFDNAEVTYLSPLVHGFLLRTDADGRLIPDLATEVPTVRNGGISRDGKTVTYHLRRGVQWQDGVPFDARDVVFSFHAALDPRTNVPDRTGFDHLSAVTEVDPYTVRVR
ncbi:MAG: hypothetical protein JOY59_08445, partial [Candidatus Eremiobacteraeota bacterium]|nr:hypothetical protein [Candidatus Eremiobacteraeota bacterium]